MQISGTSLGEVDRQTIVEQHHATTLYQDREALIQGASLNRFASVEVSYQGHSVKQSSSHYYHYCYYYYKCEKTYQFKTHCKDDVMISLH